MKKFALLLFTLLSTVLTGCSSNTELSTAGKQYNPATDARIRVFGQNGRPANLIVEINGKKEKITIGGGLGQALGSFLHVKENESIGMPATKLSKDPSILNSLLSGAFFKEFVIPAGKEVTINNEILAQQYGTRISSSGMVETVSKIGATCSGNEVKFIPQAGKDYESAPLNLTKGCGMEVYEIE